MAQTILHRASCF